jgi:hypothetical protein
MAQVVEDLHSKHEALSSKPSTARKRERERETKGRKGREGKRRKERKGRKERRKEGRKEAKKKCTLLAKKNMLKVKDGEDIAYKWSSKASRNSYTNI